MGLCRCCVELLYGTVFFFAIGYFQFKLETGSMLCRIALWDSFLLLAMFTLSVVLCRCCVELLYGTG